MPRHPSSAKGLDEEVLLLDDERFDMLALITETSVGIP
jgi:hypothetical protein